MLLVIVGMNRESKPLRGRVLLFFVFFLSAKGKVQVCPCMFQTLMLSLRKSLVIVLSCINFIGEHIGSLKGPLSLKGPVCNMWPGL